MQYEAGQRHAEILMRDMGIDEGRNAEGGQDMKGDKVESQFRAVVSRGN